MVTRVLVQGCKCFSNGFFWVSAGCLSRLMGLTASSVTTVLLCHFLWGKGGYLGCSGLKRGLELGVHRADGGFVL